MKTILNFVNSNKEVKDNGIIVTRDSLYNKLYFKTCRNTGTLNDLKLKLIELQDKDWLFGNLIV